MTLEWLYNPSTIEEVQKLGYPSYETAKRKVGRLVREGLVKRLGSIQWNENGRPIDVFGISKTSNHLLHEVLLSKFVLPRFLSGWSIRRGMDVDQNLKPDAELMFEGEMYFVELDRSTLPMWRLQKRLLPYGGQSKILLFVTDKKNRIRQVQEGLPSLAHVLLMTTIADAAGKSECQWLAIDGKEATL